MYKLENKEHVKEYSKIYCDNHQEKIKKDRKIYYENNKDKKHKYYECNKEKGAVTILCECGCNIQKQHKYAHIKSKKHLKLLEDINNKLIV
jgi:hypothetical protein